MKGHFYLAAENDNIVVSNKEMRWYDGGSNPSTWLVAKNALIEKFCRSQWNRVTGLDDIKEGKQFRVDLSELRFSIVGEKKDRTLSSRDKKRLKKLKEMASVKIKAKKYFFIGVDDLDGIIVSDEKMTWEDDCSANAPDQKHEWIWKTSNAIEEDIQIEVMEKIFGFLIPWGVQVCISSKSLKMTEITEFKEV